MEQNNQLAKLTDTNKQVKIFLPDAELTQAITSSKLSTIEKEIGLATLEKKLKDYSDEGLLVKMTGLILRTHSSCGQKVDEENIDLSINELVTDLKKYNSHLSFQEVEIYFKNGWKGEYGEWFGLNNKTYFQWVNAGTWNVHRLNAKKAILEMSKPKPKDEPSQEEQDEVLKKGAIELFENYKESKNLRACSHIYSFLERKELLVLPIERKKEYVEMAKKELAHEQSNEKAENPFSKAIQQITGDRVKSRAKLIAVRNYFDSVIEMETELIDELKENKNSEN